MEVTQSSLVILGANTPNCKVFWNGHHLEDLVSLTVDNDSDTHKVVVRLKEDPVIAEMQAAGIVVRKV